MKKISISQLNKNLPDFKNTSDAKDKIILKWLCEWLNAELETGKIKAGDFLQFFALFAYYNALLAVS